MLKMLEMQDKIKVDLSSKIQGQIRHLCTEISAVEWSGIIFYTVEGDITDPENMVITPQEILPLDKGTSGFTKYQFGLPVINFMEKHGADEKDWLIGHVHSHNSMAVFFSGTDDSELRDNSPNHKFYFSLIVNNKMEMMAKVAQVVKTELQESPTLGYKAKNKNGDTYEIEVPGEKIPSEYMLVYNCDIQRGEQVSEDFVELTKNITSHVGTGSSYSRPSYGSSSYSSREDDDLDHSYNHRTSTFRSSSPSTVSSFSGKVKGTPQAMLNLLPNLINAYEDSKTEYDEIEDALDAFIIAERDPEESAEYLKKNIFQIFEDNFEDGKAFPLFQLRTVIRHINSELMVYRKSKQAYIDILQPIHDTLSEYLKSREKTHA